MRIKRLHITGFKSFMEKVIFTFEQSVTAVVGPNGCGKSNVVDAIRWVMGEQSAKSLRGRGMEDVIFKGSETHPALSMAEVTLTMEVQAGDELPALLGKAPEIAVTRRLFRDGESEYQLNGTSCRLLDVTELFMGTGVGRGAYSIIEQGRVGQIVSARPEDRRGFIEEAAGTSKYKARRKAAERKMEYTRQNLLRVNDIARELKLRTESLERQAKKAEKYRALKAQLRDIELHSASHRWLEFKARAGQAQLDLAVHREREHAALEKRAGLEATIVQRKAELDERTRSLNAAREAVYALEAGEKLDEQSAAHAAQLLESEVAHIERLASESAAASERHAAVLLDGAQCALEAQARDAAAKTADAELAGCDAELISAATACEHATTALEVEQRSASSTESALARAESQLGVLAQKRLASDERCATLASERRALSGERDALAQTRQEVLQLVERHREVARTLSDRRAEEEAKLTAIRAALAEHQVVVIASREALGDKKSRLAALEEVLRQYEGFDRGVRAVMVEPGDLVLVSDLVTTSAVYERAIEGALGERLQYVVVPSAADAFSRAAQLRALAQGRATFIPRGATTADTSWAAPSAPDIIAPAAHLVEVRRDDARALISRLLQDVSVVSDLSRAESLAQRYPTHTFVTLAGELVRPAGVVSGGLLEGPAVGILEKKRLAQSLREEVDGAERSYNEQVTQQYELQRRAEQTESVLKNIDKSERQEELALTGKERDLHSSGMTIEKLVARISALEEESARQTLAEAALGAEGDALSVEIAQLRAQVQAQSERCRVLVGQVDACGQALEKARQKSVELGLVVATERERASAASQRATSLTAQADELAVRTRELEADALAARAQREALQRELDALAQAALARREGLQMARSVAESLRTAHEAEILVLRSDEASLRDVREAIDFDTQRVSTLRLMEREVALSIEHIEAGVQERHATKLAEAVHRFHDAPLITSETESELARLKATVERMGEVNVGAIEELEEVRERSAFFTTQQADLDASLDQLGSAIARIDEASRRRFKDTFEAIDAKFQQVFPRLFGGGRASLALVDTGGEPGVEVLAQPPGKKLQSVSLLSGGETALTAVALIFAIFLIKPTPFCILDEVDAPLDEGNVWRYNQIVREMSVGSQFILITHNKRTMEGADALYGVTMEEPGVSKLVSVNIREMAANRDVA